jgi:hypothetical protein
MAFVFINSVGTGAVTLGIFFLAESAFGFPPRTQFLLGALLGLTYVPGAIAVGPALRMLAARSRAVSSRSVLVAGMIVMGLACLVPPLVVTRGEDGPTGEWSIWLLALVYAPLSGVLWPITESYVSGGRRGDNLRAAAGRFNVVWAGAVVFSMWAMAPFVEERPMLVLAGLAVLHMLGALLLIPMGAEPPKHLEDAHEPHPPVYRALLTVFRIQLPASYIVLSALEPYLPFALERLGVAPEMKPPLVTVWLVSRLLVFVLFERWGGWHGRWWLAFVAAALMLVGFAVSVTAPLSASVIGNGPALAQMIVGLAVCGAGLGAIYAAAFYYVMEVGDARVDAGGTHEALIGMGYCVGPLCGLGAIGLAERGEDFEPQMLLLVTLIVGLLAASAILMAWARSRRGSA